jgi:hypothetical protein
VTIKETDIKRTFKEKFSDFLNTTLFGQLILLLTGLLMVIVLPILLISGLTWENIIEKYWYKWTGKRRKNFQPEYKDPYKDLPLKVDFAHIFMTDGLAEKIKEKFKLADKDLDELEIGQFKTDPTILDIKDKYFDTNNFVFDNKVFVQEVKLPSFKTDIGFIDCKDLKYQTIKTMDSYPTLTFTDKGNTLEILLRQPKMKKLISVEKKYGSQQRL